MDTSDIEMFTQSSDYITVPFKVAFTGHTRMIDLDKSLTIQQMKNEIWPEIQRRFEIHSDDFYIINSDDTETGEPISNNLEGPVSQYFNCDTAFYIRFANVETNSEAQQAEYNRQKGIYRELNNINPQQIRSWDNGYIRRPEYNIQNDNVQPMDIDSISSDDAVRFMDMEYRPPSPPSPSLIRTAPRGNIITPIRRPSSPDTTLLGIDSVYSPRDRGISTPERASSRPREEHINIRHLYDNIQEYLNPQQQPLAVIPEPVSDRIQYLIKKDAIIKIQRYWRKYLRADLSTCPVCYDEFRFMGRNYRCDHLLCRSCFQDWSARNQSCPVCRAVVTIPATIDRIPINRNILNDLNEEANTNHFDFQVPSHLINNQRPNEQEGPPEMEEAPELRLGQATQGITPVWMTGDGSSQPEDNINNLINNINNNNPIDQNDTQFGRGVTELLDIISENNINNNIRSILLNEIHNRLDVELMNILIFREREGDNLEDRVEIENFNNIEDNPIDDNTIVRMPLSMAAMSDMHAH